METYDLEGKIVVPAYIDMHVHITGGGGEQGPASRVPESQLSEFLKTVLPPWLAFWVQMA